MRDRVEKREGSHYFQEMKYYRFYFCKPDFNVYLCHVVQCEHCFLER